MAKRLFAEGLDVPVSAHPVFNGNLIYDLESEVKRFVTGIYFPTFDEGGFGRVTFQWLGEVLVVLGEDIPFETDLGGHWVYTVKDSPWLVDVERHMSELSPDERRMRSQWQHYVFQFHDLSIQACAAGIWFEESDSDMRDQPLPDGHPFRRLPESAPTEYFDAHEITCRVRWNPLPHKELLERSRLCEQTLIEYHLVFDGDAGTIPVFVVRLFRGRESPTCVLRHTEVGDQVALLEGIATDDDVRPFVEAHMNEVLLRRREAGLQ